MVDLKVSHVAYEQYASTKGGDEPAAALRAHLVYAGTSPAYRTLNQKLYPTMDFVMMFILIEPAFMIAAAND